ncbi:uroporphyrinogen-III synthase [Nautilia profundicola AmH]|uniref:Uroporphyrinogen-III synthase n=1 Tax=Nautilia profundicola (strain ATCC BAA-1463 / DSM 18972 / AmH) TaxID=598659 RepID=B9L9S4_NAUPA|nr:uroporphyrinogen-III synthase [Nautilia profundicola]ACM93054.1 uroporphyrinogen-III synthase [Nautilia profundicola AmH]
MKSELPIYLLTDQKIDGVENYPVIKINFLSPSFSFENIDYLIFTSKNGVRAVNNLTDEWKNYPSLAIGKATANEIEKLGGKVEYIAKSAYGDEFAKEINQIYKNKTFLFFRAKKLVSKIQKEFINNTLKEVIIYETVCNTPDEQFKKPSIVIFTSPSTVKCFSKILTFENIVTIAIGNKTKKELSKFTTEIFMPTTPSINECIKLAKSLKIR